RYHVPRLAFINKMDRTGANPESVVRQLKEKLGCDACLMQIPIGREEKFEGVIDLVTMKAIYFDGSSGEKLREEAIPTPLRKEAEAARHHMLEALSMYSDQLMELLLSEDHVSESLIHDVIRHAVIEQEFTPVYLGTAYRNKGVQPLLDAIVSYMPSPLDASVHGKDPGDQEKVVELTPDAQKQFVGMAFKIVDDEFGQLTFTRIYQGRVEKGGTYYNQRTGKKERFSRIVKMHADKREEIDAASAGDIVAIMGIDCASGDTYSSEPKYCTLENIFIAKPVIKMSIAPLSRDHGDRLSKALQRFRKEDPTFQVMTDEETGETVIAGMGELHLEIYVERIRREYRVEVEVGPPKVSYRESATKAVAYDFTHKKQTGGSGQYAHIVGQMSPMTDEEVAETEGELMFVDNVVGGRIPKNFIPAIEKGFRNMLAKGPVAGFPVVSIKIDLNDGKHHEVDSSDMAFMVCAQNCFREMFPKMKPVLLEPIMLMELEVPEQFQGSVVGNISARRGIVMSTDMLGGITKIMAEVPLAETFGYSTDLRSMTQGQGTFTMELAKYRPVPASIQAGVIADRKAELQPA
ncbi:MAG: elongation factor G, partial [Planctomycetes bacterium]|nr:elongation factor G [Planctomycetota bacterium]